ncbi:unnamed protein product, partial [Iphiclides podalirius]
MKVWHYMPNSTNKRQTFEFANPSALCQPSVVQSGVQPSQTPVSESGIEELYRAIFSLMSRNCTGLFYNVKSS